MAAVRSATAFIEENVREPLRVDDIAGHVGYSPSQLTRLFARVARTSPNRYVSAVRVENAKRLLGTTSLSVAEICHTVGYDSLGTFTRRFTEAVGVTPTEFRSVTAIPELGGVVVRAPARPRGGVVRGRVAVDPQHGGSPQRVWIGLFPRPVPVGVPLAGTVLTGLGDFEIPLPVERCWILAAAFRPSAGPRSLRPLVADVERPVEAGDQIELVLRRWMPHQHPVTVALLPLAIPTPAPRAAGIVSGERRSESARA